MFEEAMTVAVLFATHDAEFDGLFGIILMKAVGEILVDAGVLFFERDGEREDFLFREAVEGLHKCGVWSAEFGMKIQIMRSVSHSALRIPNSEKRREQARDGVDQFDGQ